MYLCYRNGELVNKRRIESNVTDIIAKENFKNLPPEVSIDNYTVYQYPQTVFPTNEISYNGNIAVLTDEYTYSAADAFALFCKETNFAKLFGKPTGGDGIAPSSVCYVLPNSKLVIQFQQNLGIDYKGDAIDETKTQPDVLYEYNPKNRDELIHFVIGNYLHRADFWKCKPVVDNNFANRQVSEAVEIFNYLDKMNAKDAIVEFRKELQKDSLKFLSNEKDLLSLFDYLIQINRMEEGIEILFGMDVKLPIIKRHINRTGYKILNEGNILKAIEIFKKNVELFPDDSNVYDSLAEVYLKNGQKKLAKANYQKSLELNPDNENAKQMIKSINTKE